MATYIRPSKIRKITTDLSVNNLTLKKQEEEESTQRWMDFVLALPERKQSQVKTQLAQKTESVQTLRPSTAKLGDMRYDLSRQQLLDTQEWVNRNRAAGLYDTEAVAYNPDTAHLPSNSYMKRLQEALGVQLASSRVQDDFQAAKADRLSPWEDWYYNMEGEPDDYDLKAMDTLLTGKEYPSWYELTADERTKLMGDYTRMKAQVEGDMAQATPYQSQTPTLQARQDALTKELNRRNTGYQELAQELRSSPTFDQDSVYTPVTGESYSKYLTDKGFFGQIASMFDRSDDSAILYDYIMNPEYAAEYNQVNSNGNVWNNPFLNSGYNLLTDEEKATMAAAWAQGEETFYNALRSLEATGELTRRRAELDKAQQEVIAENPVTAPIAWGAARVADLASGIMAVPQSVAAFAGYDDPNSTLYSSNNFSKNVTSAQLSKAGELLPWQVPFTNQKLGEFLYSGVTSMANTGLALGIGGLTKAPAMVSQLVMSSQAASNTLNDALTQGMDPTEATVRSVIAGAIEALTERYSIDAFLADPKSILSFIGKNMLTEASEEGLATLLNTAADGFISSVTGREAELQNEYNALLAQGADAQEASQTVLENYLRGLAGDVLLGGLTGGLMGGVGGAQVDAGRRATGKTIADSGNVPQLLDIAATMGGESGEMGRALKQTREQGGKVSNRQVGRLYEAMYKELDGQTRSIIDRTMQDAVAERLVELGDDEQLAQEVAEAIMPVVRNEKPSLGQTRTMARSQNSTQVIKELMYADDTTSEGRVKHSAWARTAAEKATSASASSLRKMGELQATAVDQRMTDKAVKRSKVNAERLLGKKATDKKSLAAKVDGENVEILRVSQTVNGARLAVKAADGTTKEVDADDLELVSRPVAEIVTYVDDNAESMGEEQANLLLHTYIGGDAGKHITDFQQAYAAGFDGRELGQMIQMDESIARQVMAQGRKDAQAAEETRQKTIGAISSGRRGAVTFSENAVDTGSEKALKAVSGRLSDTQKKSVQAIKQIARVTGVNFVFFESQADDTGRYTAENGHYDVRTGTIYLDLNSGKNSTTDLAEYAILRTAGHELTHFMEHSSKEGYAALRDFVTTELTRRGEDFDALVVKKMDNAARSGAPLTRAGAISEVVADASELMLRDTKAIERLAKKDQGLMAKIKGFIQSFVQKVRDAFSGVDTVHEEARVMMQELAEEFQQKWDFALEEAVEQAKKGAVEAEPVAEAQEQFAMREPVEQRKDGLLAVHNLSATKLLDTLRLGGFPMPSIAIIKAKHGHDMYGPYSVVFGPQTIDPEADKANRVYGNDAWTPVFPRVEREVNSDALYDVEMEIHDGAAKVDEEMARKSRAFFGNFGGTDVTDKTDQDIADSAWNYDGILAAYLLDQGEKVVVANKEVDAERPYKIERAAQYDAILDIVDVGDYATMPMYELLNKYGDRLAGVSDFLSRMNERWKQDDRRSGVAMAKFISEAVEYEGSGRDVSPRKTTVKDYATTRKAMETQIDRKAFDEWINRKLAGAFGQQGIYNGTDRFTRSGNRRSFKQTHYDYTVENVVRAMLREAESAIPATNASGLKAAASTRYGSIEEIRADSYRLGKVSEEQFNAMMAKADNDLHDFLNAIEAWDYDIQEDAGNLLVTAAKRKLNAKEIAELFKANGFKKATLGAARIAESVIRQVQTIPTGYLEAKPARVVSFDEVRMVVAPESIPAELAAELDERGIPYTTYGEAEGDRLAKLNAVEDVQFSRRESQRLLSGPEYSRFQRNWADYVYRGYQFPKRKNGGVLIDMGNLLVYTDSKGNIEHVLEIDSDDEWIDNHLVQLAIILEKDGVDHEMQQIILESDYGTRGAHFRNRKQRTSSSRKNTRATRADVPGMGRQANEEVSSEEEHSLRDMPADLTREYIANLTASDALNDVERDAIRIYSREVGYLRQAQANLEALIAERDALPVEKREPYNKRVREARKIVAERYNKLEKLEKTKSIQALVKRSREFVLEYVQGKTAEDMERIVADYEEQVSRLDKLIRAGEKDLVAERDKYQQRIRSLRSDAAKKILDEQERYRQMVAADLKIARQTREASRIQEKIATRVRKLDKLRRHETDYKNVPEAFKPAVDTLVSMFTDNFGTMVFDATRADKLAKVYRKLLTADGNDPLAQLREFYDPDVEKHLEALKEWAERDAQLRTATGMTRMEKAALRLAINKGILEAVDHVTAIVTNAQDLFYAGKKAKFSAIGIQMGDELKARQDKKTLRGSAGQVLTVLDNLLRTGNMTPVYFFEHLGNNVLSTLWDDIRQGQNAYAFAMRDGRETIQGLQQRYHYWDWADSKRKDNVLEITTEKGRKLTFTREQALWVYATWKREQSNEIAATKHLTQGGIVYEGKAQEGGKIVTTVQATPAVLSEGDIASITGWLTDEQKAYADGMVKYLSEDMAELGNRASMEMFGIRKYTESYYFPYRVDGDQLYQSSASGRVDTTSDSRLKHTSFTHALTKGASAALVMGDFSTAVEDHITRMATYASFVLPIESMNRVLNYKVELDDGSLATVRSLIEQKYGASAKNYIATLLTDLNGGVRNDNRASGMNYFIRMYKKGAVAASLSVALQQPTSIFRAMAMISPKYIAASTFSKRDWEELTRYSGVAVVKDMGRFDTDVGRSNIDWLHQRDAGDFSFWLKAKQAVGGDGWKAFSERWDIISGFLPEKMDQITWAHLWNAVKKEQADLHPEMDKKSEAFLALCGERFNDIVDHTQVYDSILSRSQLMRGKDAMSKAVTSFKAEPTVTLNMLYNAAANINKPGGKAKLTRTIAAVMTSNIAAAAMAALVQAWNDDDDERTAATKYMDKFLDNAVDNNNLLTMMPVVSDVYSIIQGYEVERADMSLIGDVWNAFKQLDSESVTTWKKVENLGGSIAKFAGLSVGNYLRDLRRAKNLITSSFTAPSTYELSTALPWAEEKMELHYDALYSAMGSGDKSLETDIREYLETVKGKSDKDIKSGVKSALKDRVLDGSVGKDDAISWLIKNGLADTQKDAFGTVDEWLEKEAFEGDDDDFHYDRFSDVLEAIQSGNSKALADAKAELKKYGYTDKNIYSEICSGIGELFNEGKITESKAKTLLRTYGNVVDENGKIDENEIYWMLEEWKDRKAFSGDDEDFSWSKYNDFYDAVSTGRGLKNAIQELINHGVEKDIISGCITNHFRKQLVDLVKTGKMTQAAALQAKILDAYVALGYDREKKLKDVKKWYSK